MSIVKKRNAVVMAFLLGAVVTLGVGYAALTDTLDIQGTADVSASAAEESFDEDVYFSAVSSGEGYTANINVNNNDKAQFTVTGLKGEGDNVTMTFTIMNESDLDAALALKTSTNSNESYFTLTHDLVDNTVLAKEGGTVDVEVTVALVGTPTAAVSGSFMLELSATTADITPAAE